MFTVKDSIHIDAPMDRCFLLSTSIELVQQTLGMVPMSGESKRWKGMVEMGDQLVWRGWKFGLPQFHETLITGYERPTYFQDTMGRGRFAFFQHDHHLTWVDGQTLLYDKVRFMLPFGSIGKQVARQVMVPHIAGLLRRRFELLKRTAETDAWKRYVPEERVMELDSPKGVQWCSEPSLRRV